MKRFWIIFFAVALIILLVLDFVLLRGEGHDEFPWSDVPGFFILLGLAGCVAIILISKLIGHHWLQKREDYYDRDDGDE